jgi:Glucose / Sorbosone dehydrogenase
VTTTGSPLVTHIREFQVSAGNPNVADSGSLREILSFAQPQNNHNGGWIGFSPQNNYLYIATGDGGGGYDGADGSGGHTATIGNAQDTTSNLLGKMLRIDPNGDDFPADANRNYAIPPTNPFKAGVGDPTDDEGDDEIWAYGLRNPFRDSFDRDTGDLWIGDVGQSTREEIDFESASSTGGMNFGWRAREGTIQTPIGGGPLLSSYTQPIYDYGRPGSNPSDPANLYEGKVSTGGYIYRGPDPSLQGKYFFLDSQNSAATGDDNYWMFDPADPTGTVSNINSAFTADTGNHQFPVSFGEDAVGNLYIAYLISGEVYRIATNQLLPGDYDADGDVDIDDYAVWRSTFGTSTGSRPADGNGNGVVDAADYVVWRNNLGASVHAGAGVASGAAVPELTATAYLLVLAATMCCAKLLDCRRRRWANDQ